MDINGNHWHHITKRNADGTPMRVRRTGQTKLWKTRPGDFRIPVKHGLKDSGYIEAHTACEWHDGDTCEKCSVEEITP